MSVTFTGWGSMVRSAVRGLMSGVGLAVVPAALLLGSVTGCTAEPEAGRPSNGASSAKGGKDAAGDSGTAGGKGDAGAKAAEKGGSVGGAGSPCALPVTFDLAKSWKPEAVQAGFSQGTVSLACEIDAKPAGSVGYIRVWTGGKQGDDVRKALEGFVAEESKDREDEKYTETKAGAFDAVEISYLSNSEFQDGPKKERAFAVATPKGVVVLHLGGLDSQEHESMLPAYELAKKTLRGV
ncbi:lipoprotein [Streptomyces sp. NPDC002187]|uniref:lipoprotein n=1 Tax=Streptomyces sp. NPDC002187 TaxID=3364637 RepID=UPI00368F8264